MRLFSYLALFATIFFTSLWAGEVVPIYQKNTNHHELTFDAETFSYEFHIGAIKKVVTLKPDATLADKVRSMENILNVTSKADVEDIKILKAHILKNMEKKFRFEAPTSEEIIAKGLDDLNKAQKILAPQTDCQQIPDKADKEIQMQPFVDLQLSAADEKELQQMLIDKKMAEEGFFDLGKFKSIKMSLTTYNDNMLHGGAQMFAPGFKKNNSLPWWEGDDRGLTFGADVDATLGFEKGAISVSGHTRGYSELAKVAVGEVEVCPTLINCHKETIYAKKDADGKRYQNFITVDGVEIALRVNKMNNQIYLKFNGGVERVTDSMSGVAAKMQQEWHAAAKDRGMIQYHNLDHRKDEIRAQVGVQVGTEKVAELTDWLAVRSAIAGKVQVSNAAENTYVGVEASVAVDTGRLWRNDLKSDPVLGANLHGNKTFNADGNNYDTIGVKLYGSVYSDAQGNVVSFFTGADLIDDPQTKAYSHGEMSSRHRADIIYSYGLSWQKKW
jgi:hypothetical protein